MHAGAVKSKYNNLDEMRNSERNILRKALVTTANQFIPSKAKQKKKIVDERWNSGHDEKGTEIIAKGWYRILNFKQKH